jgi:hypothetical protein
VSDQLNELNDAVDEISVWVLEDLDRRPELARRLDQRVET